jgi:hypothetical protein
MQLLNLHYASQEIVQHIVAKTGQRANLIAIICNQVLRNLQPEQKVIQWHDVAQAMDSDDLQQALAGWEQLTDTHLANAEQLNRLDRIVVYATIRQPSFQLAEAITRLKTHGCQFEPEQIRQSLARLELAFILKRSQQQYHYCVPLFKDMVLSYDPELMLQEEIAWLHMQQPS